jgi:hypothetical protein
MCLSEYVASKVVISIGLSVRGNLEGTYLSIEGGNDGGQ